MSCCFCKKNILIRHAVYLFLVALWCFVSYKTDFHCVIYALFGFRCPACGMTRAMLSLITGHFSDYVRYNAMALPVCLAVWFELHSFFFRKKALLHTLCFTALGLNILYYIYRIVTNSFLF